MKINNSQELDSFLKTIDPILHTTRENSSVIKHVFSELLRNVIEHSNAPYGGNVCATYNRKRHKISIGISDAGRGVFESIVQSHRVKNHKEAIIAALRPGVTGTTPRLGGTPENAGAGLFFTKCIAQSTRNHFVIYSGDAYYKLNFIPSNRRISFQPDPLQDKHTIRESLPLFNGTLIGIDIHITDTEAFNRLIQNIGGAYKVGVKKGKHDYFKRIRFT